jgi:hypothetical protein
MSTARKDMLRGLSRIDWIAAVQRLCTFAREMRGDSAEQITTETQREIARSQQLRASIEGFAERVGAATSKGDQ